MTIQQALDQKVWAVIGATHKTEKFGYKIYKCLKDHGYEVYPVNPNVAEIDGDKCYSVFLYFLLYQLLWILLYQNQRDWLHLMNAKNLAFQLCGYNQERINHLLLKKHML